MNQELEPAESLDDKLRALELRTMQEKAAELKINPENPEPRAALTAMEHKLFGSTRDGGAFHPNRPLASVAGSNLEVINAARTKAKDEDIWFYLNLNSGVMGKAIVEFLPLIEEQMDSEKPEMTFCVLETENLEGGTAPTKEEAMEYLQTTMAEGQEIAHELLMQEYEK